MEVVMTERERQEWWNRTVAALEQRDPRVYSAMLTSLVLRYGELKQCTSGHAHTHVVVRFNLEDLLHTTKEYHLGTRIVEMGVVELEAVAKGDVHGTPPGPGQSGPNRPNRPS
jgi:diadenosine tetraphosphate (Ap4A) HIT family hydrolase